MEHRADPMSGTVIEGRYEIRARLARGGMSTVYLAVDRRLDREVALKVLYPHLAENPSLVERFEQEAKTAARLSHPHVVNVLDQGVDEHAEGLLAYLVMEYVPGYTLRTVLQRRNAMTPRVALAYLEAIVDGLAAAHRAGLVHRDMKPENVLVSKDGRIKVADFGLARATTNFTGSGAALVGTVAYISPELVTGSPADERSDVYAVGIMAYEMLTGRQPFTGTSPIQVAYQHINHTVPAPSDAVPGLAAELDRMVLWCTAQDPANRPADASVLLEDIRDLRSTLPDEDLDLEAAAVAGTTAGSAATEAIGPWTGDDGLPDLDDEPDGDDGTDSVAEAPTDVLGRPDATEVISPHGPAAHRQGLDATDVIGPAATTVLPALGEHQTVVLPAHPPQPGRRPFSGAQPIPVSGQDVPAPAPGASAAAGAPASGPSPAGAGGLLSEGSPWPAKEPSARQQRRQAARQAKRPTEDLGRHSGARLWWSSAIVLIVTALLVLAGWFFGAGPGGMVTVPAVDGHSRAAALDALRETGVHYELATVHDDLVAEDSVISTVPAAGSELRRFNTVQVTVSLGPELFGVPDLSGLEPEAARASLAEAGLGLGTVERQHSDSVAAGAVLSQQPAAGASLRRGHPVSVVLSDGPRPAVVPEVTGMSRDEARRALEDAGLVVEEREVLGGLLGGRGGTVLTQDQEPGTELPAGSTVLLLVL
jgi:eukaryotic-like serine/threonine-protein kinase